MGSCAWGYRISMGLMRISKGEVLVHLLYWEVGKHGVLREVGLKRQLPV